MECPVDQTVLQMTERQGVEIDYCPQCRGVWLDRGELDKIIDRAPEGEVAAAPPPPRQERRYDDDRHEHNRHDDDDRHDSHRYEDEHRRYSGDQRHQKKRKEGFLGELFNF